MPFANIFSHLVGCLLVLLIVFLAVQKLLILMKSQKFIFAFLSLAFRDMSSKKLLWPRSKRLLLVFFSTILMVSCLTIRSFIHFEFVFVYGVRKWSSLILLHITVPAPFAVFFPLDTRKLVGHTFVGPFLGFLFYSIGLCVCFCAKTILS